ncbi:hypothetical protein B5C34_10665 [Pacificimonas flava]|uniref:Cadherin domain-containing protein n=2 Tax=Pacificimonas TaxID=1960290 RepID=A0A219B7W5_9SPHN|nr:MULTISPECIES: cadherin-like domain-containing protein [Pacificimonas]MBZ6378868.1 cadherin-like domain-containing protein [Pacificimonas aurantium]OWV33879.1 hypothetical protein B5C34_10665 [Pacificimonas flava]
MTFNEDAAGVLPEATDVDGADNGRVLPSELAALAEAALAEAPAETDAEALVASVTPGVTVADSAQAVEGELASDLIAADTAASFEPVVLEMADAEADAGDVETTVYAQADDYGTDYTALYVIGGVLVLGGLIAILADDDDDDDEEPVTPPPPPPANRAPEFEDDTQEVEVDEDGSVDVTVEATDADGDDLTYEVSDVVGGAVVDNGDGTFTYTPDADFSGDGSFVVTATDPDGETATQTVNVTINPVNDAPEIGDIDPVDTFSGATFTITPTVTDIEGDDFTLTTTDGDGVTTTITDGVVTVEIDDDFTGDTFFDLTATDENGDATTRRIELTVADGPEFVSLDVDGDGNINTAEAFDASGADVAYFDDVAIANNALITDFGAGDSITVDGDVDDYSFSNFGGDIVITSNVDGVVSEITIDADVADFVFDEATAEAALGFDFFQFTDGGGSTPPPPPPPPPAGTVDLDVDSDGDPLTPETFDAADLSATFQDDTDVASTVIIDNFSDDDLLQVLNEGSDGVSFSSEGTDLTISFRSDGGTVNSVRLTDVVDASDFVFDEATAEAAVGFDFFSVG